MLTNKVFKNFRILGLALLFSHTAQAQEFPQSWTGKWSGDCQINYHTRSGKKPRFFEMSLTVQSIPGTDNHMWQIFYNYPALKFSETRPYELLTKDKASGEFTLDEKNGIFIENFYMRNKLKSSFTVSGKLINQTYHLVNPKLIEVISDSFTTQPISVQEAQNVRVASLGYLSTQSCKLHLEKN